MNAEPRLLGVGCIMGAMLFFSVQDMLMKWLSGDYPLHEIVFVRACIAATLTLGMMKAEGGLMLLRTRRLRLHLFRGSLVVLTNSFYFMGLASLTLGEASSLFFVAPLLITGLSAFFLGEPVGPRRWAAVLVGLAGVVVMLRPGDGVFRMVALLPIAAASAYSCMQIITRRLGVTEKASTISFYVHVTFIVAAASMGLATGDGRFATGDDPSVQFLLRAWTLPGLRDAALFGVIGVLNGCGGYLMSQAYRSSEATLVAPFEYVALPMAVLWGVLVWGDWPDAVMVLGMSLIVGSGLYVLHRETVHLRRRGRGKDIG